MDNPYRAPSAPLLHPPTRVTPPGIGRLLLYALFCGLALYLVGAFVGFVSGLSMVHWTVYGETYEAALENARMIRRLAYGVCSAATYWLFTSRLLSKQLQFVVAAFLLFQAIEFSLAIALFTTAAEWFDAWSLLRGAGAAVVGYLLGRWLPLHASNTGAGEA